MPSRAGGVRAPRAMRPGAGERVGVERLGGGHGAGERGREAAAVAPGNRSVAAMMAALRRRFTPPDEGRGGLTILPPGGRPERAADAFADGAIAAAARGDRAPRSGPRLAPPRLTAGDRSAGRRVGGDIERQIMAGRGQGQVLSASVRRVLEPKLGIDLGRARIHADERASAVVRSLGAEAFAVGRDVWFDRGKYDPHTRSGQRRLMHEFAHTVQQSGLERQGRRRPKLGEPGAMAIQGLISRGSFEKLTKDCEVLSAGETKRFNRILTRLEAVHQAEQDAKRESSKPGLRRRRLQSLYEECRSFSEKNYHQRNSEWDKARARWVYELKIETGLELGYHELALGDRPLRAIEQQEKDAKALLELTEKPGVDFGVTLYAHIDHPDYSKFAQVRAELVYDNKLKVFGKETSSDIKEKAARTVAAEKLDPTAKKEEVEAYVKRLMTADCGHSWIAFEQRNHDDQAVIDEKSFGFWPAETGHPTDERKGSVHYPDEKYKDKSGTRKKSYAVTLSQYKAGLTEAFKWFQSPPTYTLVKRNCTVFAREMAKASGVEMPASFWVTPFYKDEVWNPNDLFDHFED